MAGLGALTASFAENVTWSGNQTTAGLAAGATGSGNLIDSISYTKAIANAAVGGSDEKYFALLSIVNGTPASINLASFTDIAGQTAVSLARVKAIRIRLLGINDKAPDGTTGNACSGLTVGGGATPFAFGFSTTTNTFPVNNASRWEYCDGSATGLAVTTNTLIQIANNDAVNTAKVIVEIVGGSS